MLVSFSYKLYGAVLRPTTIHTALPCAALLSLRLAAACPCRPRVLRNPPLSAPSILASARHMPLPPIPIYHRGTHLSLQPHLAPHSSQHYAHPSASRTAHSSPLARRHHHDLCHSSLRPAPLRACHYHIPISLPSPSPSAMLDARAHHWRTKNILPSLLPRSAQRAPPAKNKKRSPLALPYPTLSACTSADRNWICAKASARGTFL